MKWFKHFNDFLDSQKMQNLLDKHGYAGIYSYIRLLEIFANHFNPEDPENFIESKRDLFSKIFPKTSHKTGKKILEYFQNMNFLQYKYIGKEILFNCSIIKNLADKYTKEIMRENEKQSGQ